MYILILIRKPLPLYNDKGLLNHDGTDQCDCLTENCKGCFFPCRNADLQNVAPLAGKFID